jgi:hypothetical protein
MKSVTGSGADQALRTLSSLMHFGKRNLTLRHLKVLIAVEAHIRMSGQKAYPTVDQIAVLIKLKAGKFEKELNDLVELRYLHEMFPTFGPVIKTYKLGPMGGTFIKKALPLSPD